MDERYESGYGSDDATHSTKNNKLNRSKTLAVIEQQKRKLEKISKEQETTTKKSKVSQAEEQIKTLRKRIAALKAQLVVFHYIYMASYMYSFFTN